MTALAAILAFLFAELLAAPIFYFVRKEYENQQKFDIPGAQHRLFGMPPMLFKGLLERTVIYIGLLGSFPEILIVFGALKVATRINYKDHVSNDYFLIGNLLSVAMVLTAYYLFLGLLSVFTG